MSDKRRNVAPSSVANGRIPKCRRHKKPWQGATSEGDLLHVVFACGCVEVMTMRDRVQQRRIK